MLAVVADPLTDFLVINSHSIDLTASFKMAEDMRTLLPEAGISGRVSNYIPRFIVGCNYLSLPEMPVSGNKFNICCDIFRLVKNKILLEDLQYEYAVLTVKIFSF